MDRAFQPIDGSTVSINASTTSAVGAIAKQPTGSHQLRIANLTTAVAYYKVGTSSAVVATTADVPLPAGGVEVITVRNPMAAPETHVAVDLASGTGVVALTTGDGL